ncbi:hypothetical protein [Nonomuraea longicatena]|uniref:Uncharacterized protein n=1 Tax=Nonomuraea longicatena TaxID=83682 RepID=A0ABP4AIS1_9ACTN
MLDPYSLFSIGPAKTISSFGDVREVGPDLATLLEFAAEGRLSPEVAWRGSWDRVAEAARALLERRVAGSPGGPGRKRPAGRHGFAGSRDAMGSASGCGVPEAIRDPSR